MKNNEIRRDRMIGIFIALLSGALMSVQGVFNTEVTKGTSMWVSTSWVQFSALVVCLGAWLFTAAFWDSFKCSRNICCLEG